jgi:(p)ppGpp synthase/HD superfamily hydrolase
MPNLEDAIALAVKAHAGQVDKAGQAYILHPLRVMFAVEGDVACIVAVLHDVVEDSDTTFDDLLAMGYSEEVLSALECVTRREDETYMEFVQRAKVNPIARQVKLADMEDNMDVRRLTQISDKDRERLNRYRNAWKFLKSDDV